MASRLVLALESGALAMPQGRILLLRPEAEAIWGLDPQHCLAVQGFFPEAEALRAAGFDTKPEPDEGPFSGAVVFTNKAKAETLRLLALAMAHVPPGAQVIVDGAKGDGIESILKTCRQQFEVSEVFSKAHGKVFACAAAPAPGGWSPAPALVDGYQTRPGVFSADGIDPGSALLAAHLPPLKGRVADLGAGWGYLSAVALAQNAGIDQIDLFEAEWAAVEAARANVTDPRAQIHWADARAVTDRYDWVIANPPFHIGRQTAPELGQEFIRTAARLCHPRGRFVMVANRQLPYETTLGQVFGETLVLAQTGGYKVILASRPQKAKS